jgi:hypothetical protein
MPSYSSDFLGFCRNATDTQLQNILKKEYDASRESESRLEDYEAAKIECERRGWTVRRGEVI